MLIIVKTVLLFEIDRDPNFDNFTGYVRYIIRTYIKEKCMVIRIYYLRIKFIIRDSLSEIGKNFLIVYYVSLNLQ